MKFARRALSTVIGGGRSEVSPSQRTEFMLARARSRYNFPSSAEYVDPMLVDPTLPGADFYSAARNRLDSILIANGDVTRNELPAGVQSLADFQTACAEWKSQAFICPEHYLVARTAAKPAAATGMLDIAKYPRHHLDENVVFDHIMRGEGGWARDVLKHILQPDSKFSVTGFQLVDKASLRKYGPHLLTLFKVYDSFSTGDQLSYTKADLEDTCKPKGRFVGLHAMVIIGVREDKESGNKVYLLQNWWAKKQFVEVDQTYIQRCHGLSVAVETEQTAIPAEFDIVSAPYAETSLDIEESYPLEC